MMEQRNTIGHALVFFVRSRLAWLLIIPFAWLPAFSFAGAVDPKGVDVPGEGQPRKWNVSLTAEAGYNANVVQWNDDVALPVGISGDASLFESVSLAAAYDIYRTEKDLLAVSYDFSTVFFGDLNDFNQITHDLNTDYRHDFGKIGLVGAFRLGWEKMQIGSEDFRDRIVLRPALAYKMTDWAVLEGTYTLLLDGYKLSTTNSAQSRDGNIHVAAMAGYIYPKNTRFEIMLGYMIISSDTDGTDFDSTGNGYVAGVRHPLPWKLTGGVEYRRTTNLAKEINSLPDKNGNAVKPETDSNHFEINLQRQFGANWSSQVSYGMTSTDSSISFYSYDQTVWTAGVTYKF